MESLLVQMKNNKKVALGVIGVISFFVVVELMPKRYADGVVDPLVGTSRWSEGIPRETGVAEYLVWEGGDWIKGDIAMSEAKTIDQCLYACDEHKSCRYAAFSNGLCYLKDKPETFASYKNRPHLFGIKRIGLKAFVSDSWADSEVQQTSTSSYRKWANSKFSGADLSTARKSNLEDCLRLCDEQSECVHLTFDGSSCAIKADSVASKREDAAGFQAAVKVRTANMPDPLVKHHWTKGGEHQTDDAVYQTWAGCQFMGGDIVGVTAPDLATCLKECDMELFCHHITYVGTECMLKGWEPDSFEIVPGKAGLWAAKLIKSKTKSATSVTAFTGMPPAKEALNDMRSDFLVGEYWNEGEFKETKVNRYRIWEAFHFVGGDLHTKTLNLDSHTLEACLAQCDLKPECHHVTYVPDKECWLKSQPYQMARREDNDQTAAAATKLGRVGKIGLDDSTPTRQNRRPPPGRRKKFFTQLRRMHQMHGPTDHQTLRKAGMGLVLLVAGGGVFAGAFIVFKKSRSSFYVNELS